MELNERLDKENKRLSDETMLFRKFYLKNMANKELYGENEPEYVR